jgi:phosphotransferase system enzyme I (PtsI)
MTMQIFEGHGVTPGIGIGRAVSFQQAPVDVYRISLPPNEIDVEIERFHESLVQADKEIQDTEAQVRRKLGDDLAAIFEAHALLLKDTEFIERITEKIRSEKVNAEWAIHRVVEDLAASFQAIETPHLRDKIEDIRDVGRYLLRCLHGVAPHELSEIEGDLVIVAHDLTPSDAVRLGRRQVVGFVLETGGKTSHTAIIARSLNCPLVVGLEGVASLITDTDPIVVDGGTGRVVLHPSPSVLTEYRGRAAELVERDRELQATRDIEAVTEDGVHIELMANIELPEEIADARDFGAHGIGLYRSEFLYIEKSPELPTEDDHIETYRGLIESMAPYPVIIRTYDLGGRKLARELMAIDEDNPVLGLRGIRLTMARPHIFRIQLRALLRAGLYGDLQIMLPLISTVEEVRQFRGFLGHIMKELDSESIAYRKDIKLGVMIEVPSAALMADILAQEVDFFSLGTNDLIQYALAVDRNNEHVAHLHQPLHPAILRMIRFVVDSATEAGIGVSVCGEMAAEPRSTALLLGLGLRRLSMAPRLVPTVKALVRALDTKELERLVGHCLQLSTAIEVQEYLDQTVGRLTLSN